MRETDSEQDEYRIAARLATSIAAGNRKAETELIERYGRGLLSLLRRKTNDRGLADDLWQDTFRIAIERLRANGADDPARLAGFLRGIASNLVIAHYRRERRRATNPDLDAVVALPDPAQGQFSDISDEQAAHCVRALLAELVTERDREILRRYFLEDRDKEDICAELGLDTLHFNRVLFRAKERFRALVLRAEGHRHLGLVPGTGRTRIGASGGDAT